MSLLGQDARRLSWGGAKPLFPVYLGHTLDVCNTPWRWEAAGVLSGAGVDAAIGTNSAPARSLRKAQSRCDLPIPPLLEVVDSKCSSG